MQTRTIAALAAAGVIGWVLLRPRTDAPADDLLTIDPMWARDLLGGVNVTAGQARGSAWRNGVAIGFAGGGTGGDGASAAYVKRPARFTGFLGMVLNPPLDAAWGNSRGW